MRNSALKALAFAALCACVGAGFAATSYAIAYAECRNGSLHLGYHGWLPVCVQREEN